MINKIPRKIGFFITPDFDSELYFQLLNLVVLIWFGYPHIVWTVANIIKKTKSYNIHEYISAQKILNSNYSDDIKEKLNGKSVFVGTSAEGLRDIRATPLDIFIPGVEVHVNMVEQILQGKYLKRPDLIVGVEAAIIALAGFTIIIFAPFINAVWLGIFTITLIFTV